MPRPLSLADGILLLVPGFLLGWAAIGIPLGIGWSSPFVVLLVSAASLWGAVLCVSTSWRLLTGRSRSDGGLVSPRFLTGAAILFAAMPILSVATGSWRMGRTSALFPAAQMVLYFGIAITLFKLARKRRSTMVIEKGPS
jgi:hypothetical protein